MATLDFKGKSLVQNYHLTVKYHELVPKRDKSLTDKVRLDDNLIVHGDNLKALKALLPTYAGKVKCIYIDPPYNTGNEGWAYNDNVNSPMMQEWLGKAVDREDLTRHDKWLCMMMPRLKLLKELLCDDGLIFVSIDDNEHHNLKLLLDDIFGDLSFVGALTWRSTTQPDNIGRARFGLQINTEYVLAYSRCAVSDLPPFILRRLEGERTYPHNGKFGRCRFEIIERAAEGAYARPTLQAFRILGQFPRKSKQWQIGEKTAKDLEKAGKVEVVDGIVKRAVYPEDELADDIGLAPFWSQMEKVATSQRGKAELTEILGTHGFETVKPTSLLKEILAHLSKNALVLDSFGGSGTTAHAVLALNKEDGGNRKFILVECEDYADTITAERVRRVIKGVKGASDENLKKGLGGSFSYFELGKAIELESILDGKNLPSYHELARYVFYTATGEEFDERKVNEKRQFVGESKTHEVFLFYRPDIDYLKKTALTLERAEEFGKPKPNGKRRLVFAPVKYLDQEQLDTLRIDFAQLPFEIYKLAR